MKNRIVSMAFSKVNYPLLAVGDDFGNKNQSKKEK
jgi:hypothetical protein